MLSTSATNLDNSPIVSEKTLDKVVNYENLCPSRLTPGRTILVEDTAAAETLPAKAFGEMLNTINNAISMLFGLIHNLISSLIQNQNTKTEQSTPTPASEIPENNTQPVATNQPTEKPARSLKASGEFLWKPVSEKDGNLVILCPSKLTGRIKSVRVLDKDGNQLAKGKHSGIGNGNREHFRFNKSGASFPDGSIVEIKLSDGSSRKVTIKDTANRVVR